MALPAAPSVLHPVLVHFTIGLVPAAAGFATLYAWRAEGWARQGTYAVLTVAALLALLTMGAGFVDYFAVKPGLEGTPAFDLLELHELMGVVSAVTVAVTAAVAWWRRADIASKPGWRWTLAVALLGATLLVFATGWLGGALVYDYGVNVNDITPDA